MSSSIFLQLGAALNSNIVNVQMFKKGKEAFQLFNQTRHHKHHNDQQ